MTAWREITPCYPLLTSLMTLVVLALCSCATPPPEVAREPVDAIILARADVQQVEVSQAWVVALTDTGFRVRNAFGEDNCAPKTRPLGKFGLTGAEVRYVTKGGDSIIFDLSTCTETVAGVVPHIVESVSLWSPLGTLFIAQQELKRVVYTADGELAGGVPGRPRTLAFSPTDEHLLWLDEKGCAQFWDVGGELIELDCDAVWLGYSRRGPVVVGPDWVHVWDGGTRIANCPRYGDPLHVVDEFLFSRIGDQVELRSMVTCGRVAMLKREVRKVDGRESRVVFYGEREISVQQLAQVVAQARLK